jgi:opacity protein-like surface antigen
MPISRRLLAALTLATALLVPAVAQAAPTGVNGLPCRRRRGPVQQAAGNVGPGDTAQTWSDLEQSGAKLVRTFVNWDTLVGASRDCRCEVPRRSPTRPKARGLRVLLT